MLISAQCYAGEISSINSTIEVENYKCTVRSERSIVCQNIGRVCIAYNKMREERDSKRIGCAVEGNKNYPCPSWKNTLKEIEEEKDKSMACTPMSFGMF